MEAGARRAHLRRERDNSADERKERGVSEGAVY
jgi:hypothetical protein